VRGVFLVLLGAVGFVLMSRAPTWANLMVGTRGGALARDLDPRRPGRQKGGLARDPQLLVES